MPLTHINCAAPKYRRSGEKHEVSLDDCLSCAATRENPCQFTYELLSAMYDQQQARDYISTTTLTAKCLRSEFLKRTTDYSEDPESLYPAFRGTMFHGQLEMHAVADTSIEEARYHADVPGCGPLSGSPDLVDVAAGKLYDYKFSKENPRFSYPWGDHADQCNVNRWLVDHAHTVEYYGYRYPIKPLPGMDAREIEGALANRKRFVPEVWNDLVVVYMDDKGPKPLSVTRSEQVPRKDGNGTKAQRVLDLWDDETALAWIQDRYLQAQRAFEGGELPDIPEAMQGWEHPLCGWCPRKALCIDLHYGAAPVPVTISKE